MHGSPNTVVFDVGWKLSLFSNSWISSFYFVVFNSCWFHVFSIVFLFILHFMFYFCTPLLYCFNVEQFINSEINKVHIVFFIFVVVILSILQCIWCIDQYKQNINPQLMFSLKMGEGDSREKNSKVKNYIIHTRKHIQLSV